MIARIRRAPVIEHPLETAIREIGLRHVLWHIGQAESGQCRIEHLESAVEDELAFDVHPQLAAVFLKLPGVQSAMCGQTQIDAVVADQFLWPLRLRPRIEYDG